jgi:hypothetical protein
VFWTLFQVLFDGLGSVYSRSWVRFYVVCGALSCWLWCALAMLTVGSAGREISQEEGVFSLIPSSSIVRLLKFVRMLVLTPP